MSARQSQEDLMHQHSRAMRLLLVLAKQVIHDQKVLDKILPSSKMNKGQVSVEKVLGVLEKHIDVLELFDEAQI